VGSRRKYITKNTETNVLHNSGRRCCICYGINFDFEEKEGQIAHLDRDSGNNSEENLVWLCFVHHNKYDSSTRQGKNYTLNEVKTYKINLHETIDYQRSLKKQSPQKLQQTHQSEVPAVVPDMELFAYYGASDIHSGDKTNINFKFKNNTEKTIKCKSYQFYGYHSGIEVAKFNVHEFSQILMPHEEKVFPFNPVNPITAYFKNKRTQGYFESKVYLEYTIESSPITYRIAAVACLTIH
jgi:hypothetical protein